MNALDLYLLGRRLMKLGEEAMRGPGAPAVPASLRLIVTDVLEHPQSSIGEIVGRTGLPQSYVSQSVGRLRERGVLDTAPDPRDRRRTIVRPTDRIPQRVSRQGSIDAAGVLGDALGLQDPQQVADAVASLEAILEQLRRRRA